MGGAMTTQTLSAIAEAVDQAVARLNFERLHRAYWEQNEFLVIPQFLDHALVEEWLVPQAQGVKGDLNRNFIPGHKKGGSVSYYTVMEKAPRFLDLYRSPAFIDFLSRLSHVKLMLCPDNDPHSCALYYYTKPGDHIGFHYDTSYYKGQRYTVLIGLVERSDHCRLVARVRTKGQAEEIRETRIPMGPGAVVLFNGDRLWHAVTPLAEGEERIVLTLQYVTNQAMGPAKRLFSNLKDAFAYFGPAVLARRRSGTAGGT